MDRSFLSDENVVAASRNFVCIRLATYEDQAEADFMKSLHVGRSGQLENTTFAILSADGKRKLATAGRGPFHAFRGSAGMASGMNRIARQHDGAADNALSDPQLPLMSNVDLALNVAAADDLPLIATVAESQAQLDKLNSSLVPLAWAESLAGQFVYVSVLNKKELKPITGVEIGEGVLVVHPGQFGLSGKVLTQFGAATNLDEAKAKLDDVVAKFPREPRNHNAHVRIGIELGIDWKTQIPETDPMSLRAKARRRGR